MSLDLVLIRACFIWCRSFLSLKLFPPAILFQEVFMPVPQVAIVGRPNVGKSSLFNWLARRRLAIVDDYSGARDRMMTLIEANERYFELVDTGGMGVEDGTIDGGCSPANRVGHQCSRVILLVVDVQTGLMPLTVVAERLVEKPVILVANKTDQNIRKYRLRNSTSWDMSMSCAPVRLRIVIVSVCSN